MEPTTEKFQTLKEIRDYLATERIECLICHRSFQRITRTHLRTHDNMMADDYRSRFGIPWSYSLACPKSRALIASKITEVNLRCLSGRVKPGQKFPNRRKFVDAHRNYWRDEIRPMGPKATTRGEDGRFIDTPLAA